MNRYRVHLTPDEKGIKKIHDCGQEDDKLYITPWYCEPRFSFNDRKNGFPEAIYFISAIDELDAYKKITKLIQSQVEGVCE